MGKARNYIPALKFGHKIYPEDIAGMLGLPHVGNIYYVDGANGSDTANAGKSANDALKTISAAYGKLTNNNHDVIVQIASTSAVSETAALTWSKNMCHLIGSGAGPRIYNRARVNVGAGVAPWLTISGYENSFSYWRPSTWEDNNGLIKVTGQQNVFNRVHFIGFGNATAGDDTASYDLLLDGGGDNQFIDCTFGIDTIARSAANRNVWLDSQTARNWFENCTFMAYIDATTPVFVEEADYLGADRYTMFDNCKFISFSMNETVAMASAFKIPSGPMTHRFILHNCIGVDGAGTLDWDASNRGDMFVSMPSPTAAGAGGIATSQ